MARPQNILPKDAEHACLVGRVWIDDSHPGPRTVQVRGDHLHDLSHLAPTMADLCALEDPARAVREFEAPALLELQTAIDERRLLAPADLQAVKAAGVTFTKSLIERVIEEAARGDVAQGEHLRHVLVDRLRGPLSGVVPGSPEAVEVKHLLQAEGLWSQYLEVAIGPDPEVFTKTQPLAPVGHDAEIGIRDDSNWNNPEPEMVLIIAPNGKCVGATLGNDVNLRDFEGRSALLLGTAKDNNASCSMGPFIRFFDDGFDMADVESADIRLQISGKDGFGTDETGSLREIARSPSDLIAATCGKHHHYPDGFVLYLGATVIPSTDRLGPGQGFTHKPGDRVTISSPKLGQLSNTVAYAHSAPPWKFGLRDLARNLAARGLLPASEGALK